MGIEPEQGGCWLDDSGGVSIREDVRNAVPDIWRKAVHETQAALGDAGDAAALMELAAAEASKYLDSLAERAAQANVHGVLLKIFCRVLSRRAARFRRLEPQGREIDSLIAVPSWEDSVIRQLILEKLTGVVDQDGVTILSARLAGYTWDELAEMLQITVSAAKSHFWREIDNAKTKLGIGGKAKGPPKETDE
jgi:DNA-directed RNA polymerase specialized sigma24 family protein